MDKKTIPRGGTNSINVGNLSLRGDPGDQATRPREGAFRWCPLAESNGDALAFAGDAERLCVASQWHCRAVAESRVALRTAGVPRSTMKTLSFEDSKQRHHHHYCYCSTKYA